MQAKNKNLWWGALALVVVVAGIAASVWSVRHRAAPQAGGDALLAASEGPFRSLGCESRLFEDQPALAVTFSQPLTRDQAFATLLRVTDLGEVAADGKQATAAQSAPAANRVLAGNWVVHDNPRILVFPNIQPQHHYRIEADAGIKADGGATLAEALNCEVSSEKMAPTFFFASKGTVLPAKQNGGLPVVTVNTPEVDIQFLRVEPEQMPRFIEKVVGKPRARDTGDDDSGDDEDGGYYWDGRENNLKGQTSSWQLNQLREMSKSIYLGRFLTDNKPNRRKVTFIPVESIPELREPGIYIAVMSQPGNFAYEYQVTYFYVSDIGLHIRRQVKQTDVFTTSLTSGKALGDVELEVLNDAGRTLVRGKVDGDGHATLPAIPDDARLMLARHGKEMSMLALQEPGLDLSEFDIGGYLPRDAKLFAYAGRDLYRPGEHFTVSVLARGADGRPLPSAPLQAQLKKPGGEVVLSAAWQPGGKLPGYLQHDIVLPEDAATGRWSLELRADPAAKRPDTVWNFQVEEFLPERMKLSLTSDSTPLAKGNDFVIHVQGDYLYGAPAAGNRLLGAVAVQRARNALPKQWPGFIFGDFDDDKEKARKELDETALDDKGSADVTVPVELGEVNSPMRVRASLSLLESGGRPVVRSVERMYWPAPALIAVRPAFDRDVAREGSMAQFELVRVDANGKFVPLPEAGFKLFKENREYYWRYDDQRGWNSGFTESEELVQSGKLALKARATLTLPVDWGRYRLEVNDASTGQTIRYRFYAGWGAQSAEDIGNRPDRVQLKLEDVPAKPGSDIHVTLVPPHDGEALVLVEADKVLWSKRVSVTTAGTRVTIPIDKSWNRSDMYVSTVVFRPGSQGDRVTPARAIGLSWLPLAHEDRKLGIKLDAAARVEPEHRAKVHVKVDGAAGQPAQVTLSAVDVGILNVTNYKTPDPFDFFFGKHRFGVELADLYGKLIEKMDGIRGKLKWGGDAGMRDSRSMPRKVKLIDLFSGPVMLDAKGEADIPLDIPDFNGTLRLMAVAASADKYASTDREMTVASPIVAEISTPRFLSPGDSATLALDVTNLSGAAQDISISLKASEPLRITGGDKKLSLADKQRSILRFTAEPTAPYGLARLTLDVKTGGAAPYTVHREFALQVQPPLPREQESHRLRIEPGQSAKLDPAWVERYFRGSATVSVSLSNKPPLDVRNLLNNLLHYPYGCLEQTTSSAYPHVFVDEADAARYGLQPESRAQRARAIEAALGRIAGMQRPDGSFGLWSNSSPTEHWLSAYATGFMLDAREAGFNVPDAMLKHAEEWLLQQLNNAGNALPTLPPSAFTDADDRYRYASYEMQRAAHQHYAELAYAGFILAREQKAPLAVLRQLWDKHRALARSPLPLVQLGLALRMMGDEARAKAAFEAAVKKDYGFSVGERYYYYYEWLGDYGSAVRDYALAYSLMNQYKVDLPQRENLLFAVADRIGERHWYSTQEQLALFLAARLTGSDGAGSEWSAKLRTAEGEQAITSHGTEARSLEPALFARGTTLENTGQQPLFVAVETSGFPLKPPTPKTDVMELSRDWFDSDGQPLGNGPLEVGDMLIARVTVKSKQPINDALIIDHIPAGLEVDNQNLSQGTQTSEFKIGEVDIAEAMKRDRIVHTEYRDDRFVAAVKLPAGETQLYYLLRVVTPGKFSVPAPYAEDMYRPELRGIGATPAPITVVDPRAK